MTTKTMKGKTTDSLICAASNENLGNAAEVLVFYQTSRRLRDGACSGPIRS
jgi:hypothetical protein